MEVKEVHRIYKATARPITGMSYVKVMLVQLADHVPNERMVKGLQGMGSCSSFPIPCLYPLEGKRIAFDFDRRFLLGNGTPPKKKKR